LRNGVFFRIFKFSIEVRAHGSGHRIIYGSWYLSP